MNQTLNGLYILAHSTKSESMDTNGKWINSTEVGIVQSTWVKHICFFMCIDAFVGSTNKLISLINEITFIQIW